MLNWLKQFNIFCFLDSCSYHNHPHKYDLLVGAGAIQQYNGSNANQLDSFIQNDQWKFGHISYNLQGSLHGSTQPKYNAVGFDDISFFVPEITLLLNARNLTVRAENPDYIFECIQESSSFIPIANSNVLFHPRVSKEQYLQTLGRLQEHIQRGDCYEINYCIEFFNEAVAIEPVSVYHALSAVSPNPFSAFYRNGDSYLICASPERFLCKDDNRLVSQPIKGTISRDASDLVKDAAKKQQLAVSKKDQSENVMVVDLVRNDFSRICKSGSVQVDELFGIYTFPQVHQMISTISGLLEEDTFFSSMLKATFPMGSMTGAPKHSVMQLIDKYENSSRGIFSGSVGYITPGGDFDFNVVIRIIMYNVASGYLSYQVGSGITFYSNPEMEWEECMLKAEAIKKVLTGSSTFE
jgi:para-aminobenzoate synthetase component 1